MDLLLTAVDSDHADRDVRVEIDPTSPGQELVAALAKGDVRAWVERTRTQILADRPISEARLQLGDRIVLAPADAPPDWALHDATSTPAAFELRIVGGPSAGARYPLPAGRDFNIGRDDACEVAIDDAQASRRHAHLGVGSKVVTLTDLGSTNGTFVDGRRIEGTVEVQPGQVIEIGATLLSVDKPDVAAAGRAAIGYADGRLSFARPPRVQRAIPSSTMSLPSPPVEPPARKMPLSAALLPIVLGLVMAKFLGPVMLLFSMMGPVMMGVTLVEDKRSGRKDFQGAKQRFFEEMDGLETTIAKTHGDLVTARRAAAPNPATLADRVRGLEPELWERRIAHDDFATLRIGTSDLPSNLRIDGDAQGLGTSESDRIDAALTAYATDPDVPVDVDLRTIGVLGVAGEGSDRDALLRWLVMQSAILASPRDLAIVALVPPKAIDDWAWVRWLPHTETLLTGIPGARSVAADAEDTRAVFQIVSDLITTRRTMLERGMGQDGPWTPQVLLVVPADVGVPRPALSRVLAEGPELGVTAIVGAPSAEHLPGECRAVVRTGGMGNDTTVTVTSSGDAVPGIVVDGISLHLARDLARRLAPVQDSSATTATGEVPRRVLLLDLIGLPEPTADTVRVRWDAHGQDGDLGAPIGIGPAGPIVADLRRDGPHGLAAGTTGSGKSELLQSMIGSLAATYPADKLTFVLVDYKGGAAFKDCVALPHTVGFFTDLDAHLAHRALISLNAELRRREEILRETGTKDLIELEQRDKAAAPANLFIVFDEFAFLKKEVPEFVAGVIDIAQRGRSLGVHLMLATQRPTGVVDDNIRANTNLRIALRMADESDSNDVLDRPDAARLPKSLPGRAFVRVGHSEVSVVQSAYANARSTAGPQKQLTSVVPFPFSSGLREAASSRRGGGGDGDESRPTDLQRLVHAIGEAHVAGGIADQPKPWLDPLAEKYDVADLLGQAAPEGTSELVAPLGIVDLPARQAQAPWWLDLGEAGHVLVYGTGGAGKTQALRTIALGLAAQLGPDDLNVYGVDFASRGLKPLEALPHCGGVVTADDPERVDRLFAMLDRVIAERKAVLGAVGAASLVEHRARGGDRLPYVLVLIDGYGAFHQTYLNIDRGELVDRLSRQVAEGRSVGVLFGISADRRNAIPTALSSAISARLVLRMSDADEYASLGLPMSVAQAALPPGRGFVEGDEVQVAVLGDDATGAGQSVAVVAWGEQLDKRYATSARPAPIGLLADTVALSALGPVAPGPLVVPLGLSGVTHSTARVDLDDTPTFAVLGPDRSGRTTALTVLTEGVRQAQPGIESYLLAPRRSTLTALGGWTEVASGLEPCDDLALRLADLVRDRIASPVGPWLVVIDDGDELADTAGATALTTLVRRGRDAGAVLLCGLQTHVAHRSFGGWVTDLRKPKHGMLLNPDIDVDGELFGQRLPQKASRRFPPGRAYLMRRGEVDYIQVAQPG